MISRLIRLALACAMSLGVINATHAAQGSGCMPTTGTLSGLTFAQDVNAALAAIISGNSGASAPSTDCSAAPVKGQFWLDTSVTPNVLRQYDGTSWVVLGALDSSNHVWSPPVGGGSASITAASTTDLCASAAAVATVSGTTTITSFGSSCVVGVRKTLIFNSATPISYDAAALILPGRSSYTTNAGDVADAVYLGSGNWRVISITKIDGSSITNPAVPLGTVLYGDYGTVPAKTVYGMGQALSRASYPAYVAAATRVQVGTLTAGNNTIASVGNTSGLGNGMPVEGIGIPAGTTILGVTSSTIVMSANATANGAQSVTAFITGYGSGGDSTTIGVKDCKGRVMAGRDNMGGTAAGRLTSSYFGADASVLNNVAGAENVTMTLANLIAHTHNNTLTDPGHSHGYTPPIFAFNAQTGSFGVYAPGSPIQTSKEFTGITINNASAGSSTPTPMRTVQPTAIAECVVVVQP